MSKHKKRNKSAAKSKVTATTAQNKPVELAPAQEAATQVAATVATVDGLPSNGLPSAPANSESTEISEAPAASAASAASAEASPAASQPPSQAPAGQDATSQLNAAEQTTEQAGDTVIKAEKLDGSKQETEFSSRDELALERIFQDGVCSYEDFCLLLRWKDPRALLLIQLEDLFLKCCNSDPLNGQGLYTDQSVFLSELFKHLQNAEEVSAEHCADRLSRIWVFAQEAARNIMLQPNTNLVREHKNVPIQFVREMDTSTMVWLGRRTGRNLREKLQGRSNMWAVTRKWEINTLENRLFKAFVESMLELFESKSKSLGFEDQSFADRSGQVLSWLHSDESLDIMPWVNMEPNNLLLADQHYHKIWLAWNWLKNLDAEISLDYAQTDLRLAQMLFWSVSAMLHASPQVKFLALPCCFSMRKLAASVYWPQDNAKQQQKDDAEQQPEETLSSNLKYFQNLALSDMALEGTFTAKDGKVQEFRLILDSMLNTLSLECSGADAALIASVKNGLIYFDQVPRVEFKAYWQDCLNKVQALELEQEKIRQQKLERKSTAPAPRSASQAQGQGKAAEQGKAADQGKKAAQSAQSAQTGTTNAASTSLAKTNGTSAQGTTKTAQAQAATKAQADANKETSTMAELFEVDSVSDSYKQEHKELYGKQNKNSKGKNESRSLGDQLMGLFGLNKSQDGQSTSGQDASTTAKAKSPLAGIKKMVQDKVQTQPVVKANAGVGTGASAGAGSNTSSGHTQQAPSAAGTAGNTNAASASNGQVGSTSANTKTEQQNASQQAGATKQAGDAKQAEDKIMPVSWQSLRSVGQRWCAHMGVEVPETIADASKNSLADTATIDITSIQPIYKLDQKATIKPNYRMIVQRMAHPEFERMLIDVGSSRGWLLDNQVPLCTTADIFLGSRFEDSELSLILSQFLSKLSKECISRHLYYVVPDGINEFALRTLYRQINHFYPNAMPLPRSIGAVISYYSAHAQAFANHKRVVILVASILGSNYVLTPVMGYKDETLQKLMPKSGGWIWERFPSQVFACAGLEKAVANVLNPLQEQKAAINLTLQDICDLNEDISLFMPQSKAEQIAKRSFNTPLNSMVPKEHMWQNLNLGKHTAKQASDMVALTPIKAEDVLSLLKKVEVSKSSGETVYLLSADCDLQKLSANLSNVKALGRVSSVEANAMLSEHHKLEKQHPEMPLLWKDHLPDLYMRASQKGSFWYVPLVRDIKVMPRFGETIEVNSCSFTLPANKTNLYHFPLTQSEGGEKLRYEVQIKSPAFPLSQDVPCQLHMTYTYGAENPYRLTVVPDDPSTAPFKQIATEWIKVDQIERPSPVPVLPQKHSSNVSQLFKFEGNNLIRSMIGFINVCKDSLRFINGQTDTIFFAIGNQSYCLAYLPHNVDVVRHNVEVDNVEIFLPPKYSDPLIDRLSYEYRGVSILCFKSDKGDNKYIFCDPKNVKFASGRNAIILTKYSGYWRRHAHFVWEGGRSFRDGLSNEELSSLNQQQLDTIDDLKECLYDLEDLVDVYLKTPSTANFGLRSDLLTICSDMAEDAPDSLWDFFDKLGNKGLEQPMNWIRLGLAIGYRNVYEQQSWWDWVCEQAENPQASKEDLPMVLKIMAINYLNNIWHFSNNFTVQEIKMLIKLVLLSIKTFVDVPFADKEKAGYVYSNIAELIFVLLLSRGSSNKAISQMMDSNNANVLKMVDGIEKIIELTVKSQKEAQPINIKTFVKFSLSKPASRKAVPDLLYAVHMYLTADDGSADITVTDIDITAAK